MKFLRFLKLLFSKTKIKLEQHSEIQAWMKSIKNRKPKKYKKLQLFFFFKNLIAKYHKLPILLICISIVGFFYYYLVNLISFEPKSLDVYFLGCLIGLVLTSLLIIKQIINFIQVVFFRRRRRGASNKLN